MSVFTTFYHDADLWPLSAAFANAFHVEEFGNVTVDMKDMLGPRNWTDALARLAEALDIRRQAPKHRQVASRGRRIDVDLPAVGARRL